MTHLARYAFGIGAAAALLAGCGGSQSEPQTAGAVGPASWSAPMHGGIENWDLLYVSEGATVAVYRYWQRTQVETLTGFVAARGQCVDRAGDVYITDSKANDVVEYAHGGTKPIRIFKAHIPLRCSVSPVNGDLAIANWKRGVYVYRPDRKRPIVYTGLRRYSDLAYDSDGNLLVTTGCLQAGSPSCYADFAYLPRAGGSLIHIRIGGPSGLGYYFFDDPTDILWDGKYWVIAQGGTLYRYRSTPSNFTYVSKTGLDNVIASGLAIYRNNPQKQGTEIVGPAATRESRSMFHYTEDFWNYPRGGYPIESIDVHAGAVAISCARAGCER